MIEIKGPYNHALCYCTQLEETAREQIVSMCAVPWLQDSRIRIMPDVHSGTGCTIGTTMTLADRVSPSLVGVDIGCGMESVHIAQKEMNFAKLDEVIHQRIPSGTHVRDRRLPVCSELELENLRCAEHVDLDRAYRSIGTLGGGNHFIEVDRGSDGSLWLVVHSGSRHLGKQVATYYQNAGIEALGQQEEIPPHLAYVQGELFEDYIHDMKLTQRFAALNRQVMTQIILEGLGLEEVERFTTIHNYIDTDEMILRKGAVAAHAGQKLLIPINMRDGALVCVGCGNPEWNFSAPHGAGRLMSRSAAREALSMQQFQQEMQGVYSTCVVPATLDESPMAYKSMEDIISQIGPTAEIVERIVPLYNFKAKN